MKYCFSVEYYHGCPCHDPTSHDGIRFSNSLKEILQGILADLNEYEIKEIYSTKTGKIIAELDYEYGFHSVAGCKIKLKHLKLRTVDDGKGNLVWKEDI